MRIFVLTVILMGLFALSAPAANYGAALYPDEEPQILFQIVYENSLWPDQFYSFIIDRNGFAYELNKRDGKPVPVGSVDPEEFKYMKTLRLPASKGFFKEEKNDRLDMSVLTYYCYMTDPMQTEPVRVLLKRQARVDTVNSTPAADELVKWISLQHYRMTNKEGKAKSKGGKK